MPKEKKMTRTIEIMGSYGGTYNKGNYENDKDLYSIKEVIENANASINEEYIVSRHMKFRELCKAMHEFDNPHVATVVDNPPVIQAAPPEQTRWDIEKKMEYITIISQAETINALGVIGQDIVKHKNKFAPEMLKEIRAEYNNKMQSLKQGEAISE